MKQIVVFPRGQLSDKDRKALARAGVCVVEADDPSKVVTVLPGVPLIGNDEVLVAAMAAVVAGGYTSAAPFAKALNELVQKRHATKQILGRTK